jgi:hypothetical protein
MVAVVGAAAFCGGFCFSGWCGSNFCCGLPALLWSRFQSLVPAQMNTIAAIDPT